MICCVKNVFYLSCIEMTKQKRCHYLFISFNSKCLTLGMKDKFHYLLTLLTSALSPLLTHHCHKVTMEMRIWLLLTKPGKPVQKQGGSPPLA